VKGATPISAMSFLWYCGDVLVARDTPDYIAVFIASLQLRHAEPDASTISYGGGVCDGTLRRTLVLGVLPGSPDVRDSMPAIPLRFVRHFADLVCLIIQTL